MKGWVNVWTENEWTNESEKWKGRTVTIFEGGSFQSRLRFDKENTYPTIQPNQRNTHDIPKWTKKETESEHECGYVSIVNGGKWANWNTWRMLMCSVTYPSSW
jgi:hypothetical protein